MTPAIEAKLRAIRWKALASPRASLLTGGVMKSVRRRTKVEAYTDKHEGRVATKVHAALRRGRARVVAQLEHAFATHLLKLSKAAEDDALIAQLLEQIDTNGVGVAVVDAFGDDMREAFRQAGITAVAEVGIVASDEIVNHVDIAATSYAADRGAELVTAISESTRDEMRDLVSEAVDNGWSTDTFSAAVQDAFSFSEARSDMIARTELAFAHVAGNLEGYAASGEVAQKQWLASADACPICADLDGDIVDLDESFDFDGEPVTGPPGHPNCRCDVLPVLSTNDEESP